MTSRASSSAHQNRRIGVAFFYHESHSFSPLLTDLKSFASEALLTDGVILEHYSGTATEVGGFLHVLEQASSDVEIVPLIAAAAMPAGEVTDETFDTIVQMMRDALNDAGELDGLLIALHGAMVTSSHRDPETDFVRAVRAVVGDNLPIAVTLDLHANVTQDLVNTGVACFGFQTYPHVDMYDQGVRAATFLLELLGGDRTYSQGFAKIPALLPSINMRTDAGPMHDLVERAREFERSDDVIAVSVFGGFPYADIPGAGASVVALTRTPESATRIATDLGADVWANRHRFVEELPGVTTGFDASMQPGLRKPVVLADVADNPQSGGSADTTGLLREAVARDLHSVLFAAMFEPDALAQAHRVGVGGRFDCDFGGKSSPEFGGPVRLSCEVIGLSSGTFVNTGPMNHGLEVSVDGAVHLRHKGIDLLVTGRPITANDPALFSHIGIDIQSYDVLVLKVKNHFRAAFEPLVGDIIAVDAPGVATTDFRRLPYRQLPDGLWPLANDREYSPAATVTSVSSTSTTPGASQ